MRDYGRVHTTFWSSATIRGMSEDARTLAMYLLTSPHGTIAGVFRLPDGYVCEDLQWTSERVSKGFGELLDNGFANRCETTKWVWITKHMQWNPPENPNQRKSAIKVAASVPTECDWKPAFMRFSGTFLGLKECEAVNPSATVAEPFANQEQEQEQEQERGRKSSARGSRLPSDWTLPGEWGDWASTERPDLDVPREAECFADYWRGRPGKDGTKSDWQGTWRNWIRRANAPRNGPANNPQPIHLPRLRA